MVATLFNTGLLVKPATALSQLSIDTDKSWRKTFPVTTHSPAWATGFSAFKQRKKFTLYGSPSLWYNASWSYRKQIPITNAGAALTDYQLRLRVTRSTGTDIAGQTFLDTACLATFADLRFTAADGVTLLPYWIEEITGNDCYVWVKIPTIAATPATTYFFLYYGNAGAVSASDGPGTFIAFDDFERGVNGDPVGGLWTVTGGTVTISTDHAMGGIGTRCAKIAPASYFQYPVAPSDTVAVRAQVWKETADTGFYVMYGNGTWGVYIYVNSTEDLYWYDGAAHDTGFNTVADAWRPWEVRDFTWATGRYDWFEGTTLVANNVGAYASVNFNGVVSFRNVDATAGHDIYIDNFFVRNFRTVEPALAASTERELLTLPSPPYALSLTVRYTSGLDSGSTVYLNGLCDADFRDIRFTNNAGANLPYYVDYFVTGSYANVWVLFDAVPARGSSADFWLYFSNDSAVSISSRGLTFPLFSDGPDGTVLDPAKWTSLAGTWDVAPAPGRYGNSVNAIRQSNVAGAYYALQAPDILGDNVAIECWSQGTVLTSNHGVSLRCADVNNYYSGGHSSFGHQRSLWKRVAAANTELATLAGIRDILWHSHSLRVNGTRLTYVQDGGAALVASDAALSSANLKPALNAYGTVAASQYFTDIRIRPYSYPEPTFGNWTAAEAENTYYGVTTVKEASYFSQTWAPTLTTWGYRKRYRIFGASVSQVNYQVRLMVYFGSGPDSFNTVYMNSLCNADFSDLRFTSYTGTVLNHWVEMSVAGSYAIVWIALDSVPAAVDIDFWLYYGNAAAPDISTTTTWLQFNDGSSIVGWTLYNAVGGAGNISAAINAGKIRLTALAGPASGHLICDTQTGIDGYRVGASIQAQDGLTASNFQSGLVHKLAANNGDSGQARWMDSANYWRITDEVPAFANSAVDAGFDARMVNRYELRRYDSVSRLLVNDAQKIQLATAGWLPQYYGLNAYFLTNAHWCDFWNIYVGKYIYPEPGFRAWGTQETYSLFPVAHMGKGDLIFHDGTNLSILNPGPVGTQLTAHEAGVNPTFEYAP